MTFIKGQIPWNKGKPMSEETKQKLSESHAGQVTWNTGKKIDREKFPNFGHFKKHSEETRQKMSLIKKNNGLSKGHYKKIGLKGLIKQQNMKEPTSIEKAVYEYLLIKGILFEKQKLINGKFIVDAYIPSLNLIIEADGKYWHSLDRVVKKDKAENAYLTKCGFKIIRLNEEEIMNKNFTRILGFSLKGGE